MISRSGRSIASIPERWRHCKDYERFGSRHLFLILPFCRCEFYNIFEMLPCPDILCLLLGHSDQARNVNSKPRCFSQPVLLRSTVIIGWRSETILTSPLSISEPFKKLSHFQFLKYSSKMSPTFDDIASKTGYLLQR